jgi:hypothetical protein
MAQGFDACLCKQIVECAQVGMRRSATRKGRQKIWLFVAGAIRLFHVERRWFSAMIISAPD